MPDAPELLAGLHRRPPLHPTPLPAIGARTRRLRRRRWATGAGVAGVAVIALVAGLVTAAGPAGRQTVQVTQSPARPSGPPQLAVVASNGDLEIGDLGGRLHVIATDASQPAWSPDGRWVAFVRDFTGWTGYAPITTGSPNSLWMIRADGADLHRVSPAGFGVSQFAWNPHRDELLVAETPEAGPGGSRLCTVGTSGRARVVETSGRPPTALWSPTGSAMALAVGTPNTTTLWIRTAAGTRHLATFAGEGVQLVAWEGRSILYWLQPGFSSSLAADGSPLQVMDTATGRRATLATTLGNPNWVSLSPDGREVAVVAGGNRSVWDGGKHVEVCILATARCRRIAQPAGTERIDPAWTPSGQLVTTVAPGTASGDMGYPPGARHSGQPWGPAAVTAWYAASKVEVGGAVVTTAAHDAEPTSGGLLFVRGGSLWRLASGARQATPVTVLRPLAGVQYYGYEPWYQDWAVGPPAASRPGAGSRSKEQRDVANARREQHKAGTRANQALEHERKKLAKQPGQP